MTVVQPTPMIPSNPNIVEMAALFQEPSLRPKERTELKRALHDTVHIVRKRDGKVYRIVPSQS